MGEEEDEKIKDSYTSQFWNTNCRKGWERWWIVQEFLNGQVPIQDYL